MAPVTTYHDQCRVSGDCGSVPLEMARDAGLLALSLVCLAVVGGVYSHFSSSAQKSP